jgi:hypothetical protein
MDRQTFRNRLELLNIKEGFSNPYIYRGSRLMLAHQGNTQISEQQRDARLNRGE